MCAHYSPSCFAVSTPVPEVDELRSAPYQPSASRSVYRGGEIALMPDPRELLSSWLGHELRDPPPYVFSVTDLLEHTAPDHAVVAGLGEMVVRTKTDPDALQRMASALGWDDAMARLRRSKREGVRRGDFGEALACEVLEALDDLAVPIRKLRYQTDPEQTLHGTDVVGFSFESDGEIADLHFLECKLRTYRDLAVATNAHDQLATDKLAGYADTLEFIGERLYKENIELFEAFERYLAQRGRGDRGSYGIFLVCESDTWDEDMLVRLSEVAELLSPLHTRVVLAAEITTLVEHVYDSIGADVIDDGT